MKIEPISVTNLNKYIKEKISSDEMLNNVLVKGEISNFKHHYTGHIYFTLKDETSLIKCVMFKTYTSNLNVVLKDGMKVLVFGSVSVYERDGVYQIYCKAIEQEGIGDLYTAYEELKSKLEKEGLFSIHHKKKIPVMPKIIGVLTSNTGSVIRDIINISTRRNPNVYIRLLPVPVQGQGAGTKIAKAIQVMNNKKLADVIIIARGGGSIEDLWPFNEEIVARAIYSSEIPIISAVGHETDYTISDFVCDLRAPTPSAAAELAVSDVNEIKKRILVYNNRSKLALNQKIELFKLKYDKCMASKIFKEPFTRINELYIMLDNYIKTLHNSINSIFKDKKTNFNSSINKLDTLSPLKTLSRGYSIVEHENKIIKSYKDLNVGDEVTLKFHDGKLNSKII